jgi:hypothetical protein
MPRSRRLLLPLAAASAALCCVPVASATIMPKTPEYLRFYVSAKGSQTTTWSHTPTSGGDCYYRWSEHPMGEETVKFRARRQKVLATVIGRNILFRYGTWDPSSYEPGHFRATGTTSRQYESNLVDGPGPCGAKSQPPAPATYDCGTHNRRFELSLSYMKQHVGLDASSATDGSGKSGPFETCPLTTPALVNPDAVTPIWQSWPIDDVKGEFDKQVILADKTYRLDDGVNKATTDVQWELTLTRADKPGRKHR